MIKIGIFGGTFDPVHNGHRNLVIEAKKRLELDKIIIVPVACSPFKKNNPPIASGEDRIAMLSLAFEGIPGIEISDIEIQRGGISYTIDTIKEISMQFPAAVLFLIVTSDAWENFSTWREADEIKARAQVIFFTKRLPDDDKGDSMIEIPWVKISSTEIRNLRRGGEECKGYLPRKVLDYIRLNRLYS
jgi:nicotinate-nucleotide adenylyltransferase